MALLDAEGTVTWVNPAFTGLTGYRLAEAVGRSAASLLGLGDEADAAHPRTLSGDAQIRTRERGGLWVALETAPT
ncbi:MAG TPA: PAS domain-containing protein, partial [Phenylobacterium sp.]|nr:PAS domain-containing protein [Phenylobacterium sp.]